MRHPLLDRLFLLLVLSAVTACGLPDDSPPPAGRAAPPANAAGGAGPLFVDRAAAGGLDFRHFNGRTGELLLAEITCGAGALADLDGDGDLDVYLRQGHLLGEGKTLDQALDPTPSRPGDRVYRNLLVPQGTLRFEEMSSHALGPSEDGSGQGYGCGIAVGDVDNDGDLDLYLANLGPDRLLLNRGDSRFEDATATLAGGGDPGSGVAPLFADFDRDGRLDLFVGRNVTFDNSGATRCQSLSGAPDYCGPGAYPAEPDRLFRNLGPGPDGLPRFADVTAEAGLDTTSARPTLGAVAADFDGDGWTDLYVANDGEPNHLWRNLGGEGSGAISFREEALLAGAALNAAGQAEASMGVAVADPDDDGDFDLFLSHLVKESNTFYQNDGRAIFTDTTTATGLAAPSLPFTAFGTGFLDVENDGLLDLLVVNGAVTLLPSLVAAGDPFPLHQGDQLFLQMPGNGGPRWREASSEAGPDLERSTVSRGLALGDVDQDGDADALVIDNGGPVRLLVNQRGQDAPWLGLRLLEHGRDAHGAVAALLLEGHAFRLRRVAVDGSYGAASDPRLLFGLGDGASYDGVRVWWSDGTREDFPAPARGRYTTLRRGAGAAEGEDIPSPATGGGRLLIDATADSGLDFVQHNGSRGTFHIAELMGSGVALFDLEGDGDLDLYLVDGGSLPGDPARPPEDRLYRNESGPGAPPRWVDVTDRSGITHAAGRHGMGVAVGDIDADGRPDLLRTALGPPSLWHNLGDGRFEDWSDTLPPVARWTVPAVFFDADADGDLDLFLGGYLDPDSGPSTPCAAPSGRPDYCGARHYRGLSDHLLENMGPGDDGRIRWRDIGPAVGLAEHRERALGAVAADLDGDHRLDLFVANDAGPNHLWRRHGGAAGSGWEEIGLLAGVAVNGAGAEEASMGIAVGDPDADADLDLLLTHLVVETHTYYRQRAVGLFEDATAAVGLAGPSRPWTGFGTTWLDADGDGGLDLFVANGAVQRGTRQVSGNEADPYREADQLFLARPDGALRFVDHVSTPEGASDSVLGRRLVSRGVATGDLDDDGDLDLVVTANGGPARLLLSTADPDRWWGFRVLRESGEGVPRPAVGATLEIVTDRRRVLYRVARDGSYASSSDPRVLFVPMADEAPTHLVLTPPTGEPRRITLPPPGRHTDVIFPGVIP